MAAESQYNLNIPYTGDWNETPFDAQYVKTLRGVLDKERPGTKIVCCDEYPHEGKVSGTFSMPCARTPRSPRPSMS